MARRRCWQMRQASKDPFAVSDLVGSRRRPPHMAKDALGAAVTLAVIRAFLLQAPNRLGSSVGGADAGTDAGQKLCSCAPAPLSLVDQQLTPKQERFPRSTTSDRSRRPRLRAADRGRPLPFRSQNRTPGRGCGP